MSIMNSRVTQNKETSVLSQIYEICSSTNVFFHHEFFMDSPSIIEAKQLNQSESMTTVMNKFVKETLDQIKILVESSSMAEFAFTDSKHHLIGFLTQSVKDAHQNYIICPTNHLVTITPITSIKNTYKDRINALFYLVIWSRLSEESYQAIIQTLVMTNMRITHYSDKKGVQLFEQGGITSDCIWRWLQCLTKCVMCSASHAYQKKYTITTHACLVFALPAAIMDTCPTFIKIGVNPVGPIFGINPQDVLSPKMLETSTPTRLKETPLLLMTWTFIVWCSRRLGEEVGILETTNNLQTIAENFGHSPKKYKKVFQSLLDLSTIDSIHSGSPKKWTEHTSMIEYFTSNFSSIHATEKFCLKSASERPTSKPETSKRGNLSNPDPTKASALKYSSSQQSSDERKIHQLCIPESPSIARISEVQRDASASILIPPNNPSCSELMSDQLFGKIKLRLNRMKVSLQKFQIFSHGDKYMRSEPPCREEFQKDALSYQERCLTFTGQMFFNCDRADRVHMYKGVSFMGLVIQCLTSLDRIETSHHNILAQVMLLAICEGTRQSNGDSTTIWKIYCLILLPKDCFGFRFRLPEYRQLCLSVLSIVPPNKEHLAYYTSKYKI